MLPFFRYLTVNPELLRVLRVGPAKFRRDRLRHLSCGAGRTLARTCTSTWTSGKSHSCASSAMMIAPELVRDRLAVDLQVQTVAAGDLQIDGRVVRGSRGTQPLTPRRAQGSG